VGLGASTLNRKAPGTVTKVSRQYPTLTTSLHPDAKLKVLSTRSIWWGPCFGW